MTTDDDPELEYRRAIEAVVLVAHDPVPPDVLAQLLERPVDDIERWCDELAEGYRAHRRGFELVRIAGGYRYQTVADLVPYVERFLVHDQRARLSGAALETLAIIAYKQPAMRAEIETIRGVACGEVIRVLMDKHLVKIVGRAEELGRPMLYGTTKTFLEVFGLSTLKDLPNSLELQKP